MNLTDGGRSGTIGILLIIPAIVALTVIWVTSDQVQVSLLATLVTVLFIVSGYWQIRFMKRLSKNARRDRLTRRCRDLPYIGVSLIDLDDDSWYWNNATLGELLGVDPERFSWEVLMSAFDLSEREAAASVYAGLKRGERDYAHVERRIHRLSDGVERWLEVDLQPVTDIDGKRYLLGTCHDITARRQAISSLQRQRDLYEVLSQTNKLIVRVRDRQSLLEAVCTVAVQHGHLCHAWAGRLIDGELKPVAWASDESLVLQRVFDGMGRIDTQATTFRALQEDRVSVCNSVGEQKWDDYTLELAQEVGIESVAAFPLRQGGDVIGNLTLYSKESGFFDPQVLRTLSEMASDIGYALDNLERQQGLETARQIIESSPVVVLRWSLHAPRQLLFASENILRWGYRAADLYEAPLMNLVAEQDRPRVDALIETVSRSGEQLSQCRFRVVTGDGDIRWVEAQIIYHRGNGHSECMEAVVRDVQSRKQHEDRLNLAAAVFRSTREGVVVTDSEQCILEVNPAFSELLGYAPEEVIGKTPKLFSSGRHDAKFYREMWRQLDRQGSWQGEIWNRRKDGELIPEMLSITRVDDPDGGEGRYVAVFTDVTEIKRSNEQIEFLAHMDPVTGLPNRMLMQSMLEQALRAAKRHVQSVALLILDLDHFKDINDSYGHSIGDELLQLVADRLRAQIRESDALARLGGDEFAVLLTDLGRQLDAATVAQQLIEVMSEPFRLSNGIDMQSGVSIGISLDQPGDNHDRQELMKQADAALYQAKSSGRGSYSFYSRELSERAAHRLEMEIRLRRAFQKGELEVHYQPQVDIADGRIIGAEALLRWHDPERGNIPPDQFIPLAEQSDLIVRLGDWVLEQVCQQGRTWLDQGASELVLAVNLSPAQLRSGGLAERVDEILKRTGFPAHLLELELTEGALMRDPEGAAEQLGKLRDLGVGLSLDDFGTGYSSLSYLKRFPIVVLKIDKSFIAGLPSDLEDSAISRTVVAMGHALGMSVLAEGVETPEQLEYLRDLGCDVYQGYLCSPALPPERLSELVKGR